MPPDVLMFVHTQTGAAYKSTSFGNEFRDWCKEAGLPPQSSAHGVRKAAGRRMAETGVSAKGIMSVLGHSSLFEAGRYTKSADQIKLADDAISKLR
ncbi:MAG: site-specific integrase [Asticcacaulis sp.]|uniref:tyrosine-type recombinase/integrase n=1 Tax=Asticcacaulis sp. TaxID=1872648 RepID=UPI0025BC752B|nr:tyrosine-type recombinase/integrase [Asticcacaulis sp.]MCA1936137.1 site-specific integrase [Asticcacaulis sp.]